MAADPVHAGSTCSVCTGRWMGIPIVGEVSHEFWIALIVSNSIGVILSRARVGLVAWCCRHMSPLK